LCSKNIRRKKLITPVLYKDKKEKEQKNLENPKINKKNYDEKRNSRL
jgi:hypothetical protein